jgi:L-threonylcarbamoyladenylate synthase
MNDLRTQRLSPDRSGIEKAAAILRSGGLVSFPTETVYGLGADARDGQAVAAIYAAKGRPSFNPLIVHLPDLATAQTLADFDDLSLKLARAFWPGPLTLVLPLKPDSGLSDLVTAGLPSVALRVPAHPVAHRLLAEFAGPVAAPSANPSGQISPTTADHVLDGLSGKIDAVIDGGPCPVGLESTIALSDGDQVAILRDGGVTREQIEACLGRPVTEAGHSDTPQSPGQLASHYAPSVQVRLNADARRAGELLLGFGPYVADADLNLSPAGDLIEAAANLFGYLRQMDERAQRQGIATIAVSPIPTTGLGAAINDRLKRAAAPRG